METKFGSYWIVEISFRPSNPKHRAIGCSGADGHWQLFSGGYENVERIYVPHLIEKGGSFETIREILIEL